MKILLAIAAVVMLSACSPAGKALVEGGISEVQAGNDSAANIGFAGLCGLPYGSVLRRPANERLGAKLICDPSALEELMGRITQ